MIYLAMANTDYEGSAVIRAFEAEADATAFVEACRNHQAARPRMPDADYHSAEGQVALDAWDALDDAWLSKHPAPQYTSYDSYSVLSMELVPVADPS